MTHSDASEDESHRYEVFPELDRYDHDMAEDDDDDELGPAPDGCGVCGRLAPLRVCRLDPAAQPGGQWAIASNWYICSNCLAIIALGDPVALKGRLRIEDQTAPYADALIVGLLSGIHIDS